MIWASKDFWIGFVSGWAVLIALGVWATIRAKAIADDDKPMDFDLPQ